MKWTMGNVERLAYQVLNESDDRHRDKKLINQDQFESNQIHSHHPIIEEEKSTPVEKGFSIDNQ